MNGQLDLNDHEKIALWVVSLSFAWFGLCSLVGLWGSLSKGRGSVGFYAYTVTFNTFLIIAVGIYFVWALFHGRGDDDVQNCVDGDAGDVKQRVCQKGFDVIRILIVVAFVIIWIFQLAGIFIVFDYVGQLREENELEDSEARKISQPAIAFTGAAPAMRTTYDTQVYDNGAVQNGWASARSPYAFNQPQTAQMTGR